MQSIGQVLTVIVLYQMKLADTPAYQSLSLAVDNSGQQGNLYVYDNSPSPQAIPESKTWHITYEHDRLNPGVSGGYNQAFKYASSKSIEWILLSDQDTLFDQNILQEFKSAAELHPDCGILVPILYDHKGIISPFKRGRTSGKRLKQINPGIVNPCDIQAINSGILIRTKLFETCGGYDERFKLDFSDVTFFKKLCKSTGTMVVTGAKGKHNHSSTSNDLQSTLQRFQVYKDACRMMGMEANQVIPFAIRSASRALKLTYQHKSLEFLKILAGHS